MFGVGGWGRGFIFKSREGYFFGRFSLGVLNFGLIKYLKFLEICKELLIFILLYKDFKEIII